MRSRGAGEGCGAGTRSRGAEVGRGAGVRSRGAEAGCGAAVRAGSVRGQSCPCARSSEHTRRPPQPPDGAPHSCHTGEAPGGVRGQGGEPARSLCARRRRARQPASLVNGVLFRPPSCDGGKKGRSPARSTSESRAGRGWPHRVALPAGPSGRRAKKMTAGDGAREPSVNINFLVLFLRLPWKNEQPHLLLS